MSSPLLPPVLGLCLLSIAVCLSGCTLGSDEASGCRKNHPEDCESGWTCRSGVCFKPSTALTDPSDAASDSSSDAAADSSSDASPEASSDAPSDSVSDAPLDNASDVTDSASDSTADAGLSG